MSLEQFHHMFWIVHCMLAATSWPPIELYNFKHGNGNGSLAGVCNSIGEPPDFIVSPDFMDYETC